jgi:ATP-dependent DNA ligase
MTTINTDRYIYPPRPSSSIPRNDTDFFQNLGWIAQLKYNGSRCLIKHLPNNTIQLWNRHAERFRTYHTPNWLQEELKTAIYKLGLQPNEYHVLDGELLDQKHSSIKDVIVIWDVLVKSGEHLLDTQYIDRYNMLTSHLSTQETWKHNNYDLGIKLTDHVLMPKNYTNTEWDTAWDTVHNVNAPYPTPLLEGIVLKDPNGLLERGFKEKNNGSWMIRSRITTGRHTF